MKPVATTSVVSGQLLLRKLYTMSVVGNDDLVSSRSVLFLSHRLLSTFSHVRFSRALSAAECLPANCSFNCAACWTDTDLQARLREFEYVNQCQSPTDAMLTFDDGPHPIYTPLILDMLRKYNVKATFFLIGRQAFQYPNLVNDIIKDGHAVGMHTFTHADLQTLNLQGFEQERQASALCSPSPANGPTCSVLLWAR